ncbi:MAG: glycosyltransferase [Endomicrobiaceae bacterium]|nr:glycosyltransferase [Endomicrobiaceae bacterium]
MVKKNLLIISPVLPNPEMSAGDYRVYSLTQELKKYFNIFFIPLNYKKLSNIDIKNFSKITKNIVKPINSETNFKIFLEQNNISICIFEKYFSMPFDICKFIPLIKIPVVDVHEIGFIKSDALSKIKKTDNLKLFKAKELLFYKNAKLLIAITDKEKKILKEYFPNKKIVVIPTCTTVSKSIKNSFEDRKDICYFGFFEHKPNIDAANYFIKNIFNKIKIPDIKFYVLGYGSKKIKNTKNIVSVDKIKDISKELSKYKVFVCPLRYGAGLKKKVLDAMAAKTPIVSASFGVEGIKKLEDKFFDIDSKTFINKIIELYTDKKVWIKESNKNYSIVKKYYSINSFKNYVKNFVKTINN